MSTTFVWRQWFARPPQEAAADTVLVENHTARRIVVEPKVASALSEVVLGPFETREMPEDDLKELNIEEWQRQCLIAVTPCPARDTAQDWWGLLQSAALRQLNDLLQVVVKWCTFLLTMLIGFGLTAIPLALWFFEPPPHASFTDVSMHILHALWFFEPPPHASFTDVFMHILHALWFFEPPPHASFTDVFMHILQWYFMGLVSVLPAIMYFLFYRQKVRSLRESFLRNIVRLNPNIYTI